MNILEGFIDLIEFFTIPFTQFLQMLGIADTIIQVGFGDVIWFSFELQRLSAFVIGTIIIFIIYRFIFKLISKFISLITGGMFKL